MSKKKKKKIAQEKVEKKIQERGVKIYLPDLACLFLIFVLSSIYFYPAWRYGKVYIPADIIYEMTPWNYYAQLAGVEIRDNRIVPHNGVPTDVIHHQYPYRLLYHRGLHEGKLPLWNRHQFCGAPFYSNDQSALFYPFNFLFYLVSDPAKAYTFNAWFHLWLGGVFMFLLLRFERAGRAGALLGATVFMFNGCAVAWKPWASFHSSGMWAPLVLLLAGLALRRRKLIFAILCGISIGVMLTSGLLQYASFTLFALALYFVYHVMTGLKDINRWKTAIVAGAIAAVVGLSVAAVHVLPAMNAAKETTRVASRPANGWFPGLPREFKYLKAIYLPDSMGNPVDGNLSEGVIDFTERTFYIPGLALLLCLVATAGIFSKRFAKDRRIRTGFYVLLCIFGISAMFGAPPYALYYYLVPGAKTMLVSRIGYLFTFSSSVLAGVGLNMLTAWLKPWIESKLAPAEPSDRKKKKRGGETSTFSSLARKYALGATAGLVILVIMLCLLPWAMKLSSFFDREMLYQYTDVTGYIQEKKGPLRIFSGDPTMTIFPNTAMALGLDDVRGYDSLAPARYANFMDGILKTVKSPIKRRAFSLSEAPGVVAAQPLNWLNVRYIISSSEIDFPTYRRLPVNSAYLYENERAYERCFFTRGYRVVKDADKALEVVTSNDYRPEVELVVEKTPEFPRLPRRGQAADRPAMQDSRIVKWEAEEIVLDVATPEDALLFFSEQYHYGWKATIDSAPAEIVRASYTFRAVPVPAGRHELRMWYAPRDLKTAFHVSFFSLLAAGAAILLVAFFRRGGKTGVKSGV